MKDRIKKFIKVIIDDIVSVEDILVMFELAFLLVVTVVLPIAILMKGLMMFTVFKSIEESFAIALLIYVIGYCLICMIVYFLKKWKESKWK